MQQNGVEGKKEVAASGVETACSALVPPPSLEVESDRRMHGRQGALR